MNAPLKIQVQSNSIAIIDCHEGAGGLLHSWLRKSADLHVACFVNPSDIPFEVDGHHHASRLFSYPTGTSYKGIPMINSANWPEALREIGIKKVVIATPYNEERFQQIQFARKSGLSVLSAIHPSALILDEAVLGEGVLIQAGVIIGYKAEIQDGVTINTGAQIDHHNIIETCVEIDPGVVTAGNVTVGRFATLHTGAVVINKIRIGEKAIVGAGAVIIRDVPDGATVVGVPGRIIKQ